MNHGDSVGPVPPASAAIVDPMPDPTAQLPAAQGRAGEWPGCPSGGLAGFRPGLTSSPVRPIASARRPSAPACGPRPGRGDPAAGASRPALLGRESRPRSPDPHRVARSSSRGFLAAPGTPPGRTGPATRADPTGREPRRGRPRPSAPARSFVSHDASTTRAYRVGLPGCRTFTQATTSSARLRPYSPQSPSRLASQARLTPGSAAAAAVTSSAGNSAAGAGVGRGSTGPSASMIV